MSYTAANNNNFARRMQQWMLTFQNLREEAMRLDAIYTNEALSGAHGNFVDTSIATSGEIVDGINLYRDLEKFVTDQVVPQADRETVITPFIQVT